MQVKPSCVECSRISFSYGHEHQVLNDVSFIIRQGDYVGIIGPNGGGKTTLIKIIAGLITPAQGTVSIYGQPVSNGRDYSLIGYVPQRIATAEHFFPATVEEIVESGRTSKTGLFRKLNAEDRTAIGKAMEVADVSSFRHRLIGSLSGGERQRVFIARALAAEPKILILDEPTVGVDSAVKEKFERFLTQLNEKSNITIILISHDINVIAEQVHYVLCLNNRLVCHVPTYEFIRGPYLEQMYGNKIKLIKHDHEE